MRISRGLLLLLYILWCITPLSFCQGPQAGTAPFFSPVVESEPSEPDGSAQDTEPIEPDSSAENIETVKPDSSTEDIETVKPDSSAEDIETVKPDSSAEDVETVKPDSSAEDAGTTKPDSSVPEQPTAAESPSETEPESEQKPVKKNTKLYVLMYHHFIPEGKKYNNWMVTDIRFREDLQWLADHGWTTVLPSQLVAGEPLPDKAVMLTFDDGYRSNYQLAYPLLREYQAKAVISIIVKNVDDQQSAFLTWDMCREMAQSGLVEFGSHTYASHDENENGIKRLAGETREEYEARILPDLQTSIDLMEANLGKAPLLFAYPNGVKDSWAAGFIQDHFSLTLITRHGSCDISKGLYSLKRCNVSMGVPLSDILPD